MLKFLRRSNLTSLFVVATAFSALAQVHNTLATDANTKADSPARSGQAPDEATTKIAELVHAGKYTEAQQVTTGLLLVYPNDLRLIKAKALIGKLPAPSVSTTVPNGTVVQLAASRPAEHLTGMDKVDYDSLIELGHEAQQNTDLGQQKKLLQQFMDRSGPFLQKHPNEMLLWHVRAASAISLDDPIAGYEAGQELLAAGAADSSDANLRHLLAQLNLKGWLDKEKHQAIEQEKQQATWTDAATGYIWTKQDNGGDVGWNDAKDYCSNLRLAGYATWQLPTTEELGAIRDQVVNGAIKLTGRAPLAWGVPRSGEPCYFMFDQPGGQHCANAINRRFVRVLCIRRPGL
jgi:Protein of unknown function (DUF1566)